MVPEVYRRLASLMGLTVLVDKFFVLKGNGFGHGVGLSQEGAMTMVDLGYSYTDVLHFYYTNVYLIDDNRRIYYLME